VLATARTFTLLGIDAHEIRVEVDVRQGLPAFTLVGLPDAAVRESRERVRAALVNSGFEFPQGRISANLAPADLRKAGPGFDLAIAAAVLAATDQLPVAAIADVALAGELALDGSIRPVPGTLAMAERAGDAGIRALVVPAESAAEAALIAPRGVIPVDRLEQLRTLGGEDEPAPPSPAGRNGDAGSALPDLADLRGQPALRRALEIAAAGGHSLLVTGPPGAGKSMAARRLPSILPPLDADEVLEAARVASACGRPVGAALAGRRAFRAPHHTISTAGLIGGGNPPRAGEVTLAHAGVLFLDELPEFGRGALEALRQPLEEGTVRIARARYAVELPCRFQLLAAANPCPCGRGPGSGQCVCDSSALRGYEGKLSAALADRIDVSLAVAQPGPDSWNSPGEASTTVLGRVLEARERQRARDGNDGRANAQVPASEISIPTGVERLLAQTGLTAGLSGRGRERAIRLARTIADLDHSDEIAGEHAEEALTLRRRAVR
jgi:magnesium chelatase family protein